MSEPLFSLEEIAEAFKYIQDDKLSTDAKAMLTMDIGYEKAEKDIVKLLEVELNRLESFIETDPNNEFKRHRLLFAMQLISNQIALIKGGK